jgi:SAM-dependent methyltransferase
MAELDDKLETQKQWDCDPCGAVTAGDLELGTPQFFARVEAERYDAYAPWMPEVLGFSAYRGQRVLEIGPGLGTDHAQFARAGAQTFGVDLSARHLELTRTRFRHEGLTTRLAHGDVEDLPFRASVFDAVYAFGVIHHTPDMDRAVGEIHRVLRPGGMALIALYHRDSAFYWIHTLLLRGIVLGGLVRKGYRQLLSEIEYRSGGSDAVPLVQVLSLRRCRGLFAQFSSVSIRPVHIDFHHFTPKIPPSPWRYRRHLERVMSRFGWYLVVSAKKER